MQNLINDIKDLKENIDKGLKTIDFEKKSDLLNRLKSQTESPDFWQDNQKATEIMQKISEINNQLEPWQAIYSTAQELLELANLNDENLLKDINAQYESLKKDFNKLNKELVFRGPYDYGNAIINLFAGAGGTDAQDWAQMLLRMYVRWSEKSGYKTNLIEESSGDEAGIKSASLQIKGNLAYGKLKNEAGVHRLVRLSPFNADNLRQTSFARVEVLPEIERPEQVPIDEKDLKIDVFRAGGHGGQSVNTTDSAVRVTHLPTNISVSIQNERSQIQNKETALKILRSKLVSLQLEQHKEKIADLKGPSQANEWGSQIRNYVLHPYKQVKDLRSKYETSDVEKVLDGDLDALISSTINLV